MRIPCLTKAVVLFARFFHIITSYLKWILNKRVLMPNGHSAKLTKKELLSCAITELYSNQSAFHQSMDLYCAAFTDDVRKLLNKHEQKKLDKFLHPYRELIHNPFVLPEKQTASIKNIAEVISETNNEFNQVWRALSICNAQFAAFNHFLTQLEKNNFLFIQKLNANLFAQSESRLQHDSFTIKPVQHSMRYKLTLTEIKKYTDNKAVSELITLLEHATLRMNYHLYTREIITELEELRNKKKRYSHSNNPIVDYIDSLLNSDFLNAHLRLTSQDSHTYFLDILTQLHKRLVELSYMTTQFGSASFFSRSNPFLKKLQGITKRVEQRYLDEIDRRPVKLLT